MYLSVKALDSTLVLHKKQNKATTTIKILSPPHHYTGAGLLGASSKVREVWEGHENHLHCGPHSCSTNKSTRSWN